MDLPVERFVAGPQAPARSNRAPVTPALRAFLAFEASTFVVAAAVHFEVLLDGYGHLNAAVAEAVIALVLLAGLALTWTRAPWPLRAATAAQAFAMVGVLIGLATIAVGVGPQTVADVAYHLAILVVLAAGLVVSIQQALRGR